MWFLLLVLCSAQKTAVVQTDSGPVQGLVEYGVNVFRGIPFAAPPINDLRWKPPQPPASWSEVLACETDPDICSQSSDGTYYNGTEDCLYLNVYAPPSSKPLPVAVWIYGGGFSVGGNNYAGFYDGTNITRLHDYIMVAGNYRLGSLGFLSLDALRSENSYGSTGNYGTMDQVAVLQWVQRNIKAFGGDPTRVSIFGESAGASSVCWHMASPLSKGLFTGGLMESGNCDTSIIFLNYTKAQSWSKGWAESVGCANANLTCLRALPTNKAVYVPPDLFNMTSQFFLPLFYPVYPWVPVIDGAALPDSPYNLMLKGQATMVPYTGGSNENEGINFVPMFADMIQATLPLNKTDWEALLDHFFCANATLTSQVAKQYPIGLTYKTYDQAAAMMMRDWFFACPTKRVGQVLVESGYDAYIYHFAYKTHWHHLPDTHFSEIPFVFDNPGIASDWNADDQEMADIFGSYWGNMFTSGSPNTPQPITIQWPRFVPQAPQQELPYMRLALPTEVELNYDQTQCEFWDQMLVECASSCGC